MSGTLFDMTDYEAGFDDFGTAHNRVYVSFSGGKDSVATLLRVLEVYPKHIVNAVFCDTGDEDPETYEYLPYIDKHVHRIKRLVTRLDGIHPSTGNRMLSSVVIPLDTPLETVKANYVTVYDEIIARHKSRPDVSPYPDFGSRHCTKTLKINALDKYIRSQVPLSERHLAVKAIGVRRAESKKRANRQMFVYDPDTGCDVWHPIVNYTLSDVWNMHKKHGVKRNSVYAEKDRAACKGCYFTGVQSIQTAIARHGADVFSDWLRVEQETGYKMFGHIGISDIIAGTTYDFSENPLFSCASGYCDI